MAIKYLTKLNEFVAKTNIASQVNTELIIKHFFSGGALYSNGSICASWSPVGLAFKIGRENAEKLIKAGKAEPFKYFFKGYVKKDYILLKDLKYQTIDNCEKFLLQAIKLAQVKDIKVKINK